MNNEEFFGLQDQLPALRKQFVGSRFGRIPKSIEYLEKILENETALDDRVAVYELLLGECSRSRNDGVYLHFLRQRAHEFPDDPFSYTGLATVLAYERGTQAEALKVAAQGVSAAKKQDRLVRYSLTSQVRIALMLDDYETLNHALGELVADAGTKRTEDTVYVFDFIDQIDVQRCDTQLLARYKELERKKGYFPLWDTSLWEKGEKGRAD